VGVGQSIIQPRKIQWGVAVREKYDRKRNIINFKCSQHSYMHTFHICLTQRLKNGAASVVRIFFRVEKARPSSQGFFSKKFSTILLQSLHAFVRGSNYTSRKSLSDFLNEKIKISSEPNSARKGSRGAQKETFLKFLNVKIQIIREQIKGC
jgi:hypothetical protein